MTHLWNYLHKVRS